MVVCGRGRAAWQQAMATVTGGRSCGRRNRRRGCRRGLSGPMAFILPVAAIRCGRCERCGKLGIWQSPRCDGCAGMDGKSEGIVKMRCEQ
eukprot:5501913-Prymnesium_polylepis.1